MKPSMTCEAVAKAIHAHELCCGLPLDWCPVSHDLYHEAREVMQELDKLGYRVRRKKVTK